MAIGERNLTPERGPNVWETMEQRAAQAQLERWAWTMSGVALAGYGIWRRDRSGLAMVLFGSAMAIRAVTGWTDMADAQRWAGDALRRLGVLGHERDRITGQSDESFPASDAPSWTPTTGTGTAES